MRNAFDKIEILLIPEVYDRITSHRYAEFMTDFQLTENISAMCANDVVEYTWHNMGGSCAFFNVMIYRDGRIWVSYNKTGKIEDGIHCMFQTYCTEEDLFMLSTVQDDLGINLDQIKVCNLIWEMYY